MMTWKDLPVGSNPKPLEFPHFPSRLQAVVWRNWELVPAATLARILKTDAKHIRDLAKEMGLAVPQKVDPLCLKRAYATIIRSNWHLLPYPQLLDLLGWTAERLDYALREDDFLWGKLGALKPAAEPVVYAPLNAAEKKQTDRLRKTLQQHFPDSSKKMIPLFAFIREFHLPEDILRLSSGKAKTGEITLDDSWCLVVPSPAGRIAAFVKNFLATHQKRWGFQLQTNAAEPQGRSVILAVQPDASLPADSHSIEVAEDTIRITAVNESGVLYGLQWLELAFVKAGGPFVKIGVTRRRSRFDLRFIYPYYALYGDTLLDPEFSPPPEGLLARYSRLGINGIWIQAILYTLVPLKEMPELAAGCQKRLENLRLLAERAADYGIGVYLYLNEPRGMPPSFFAKFPDWKGVPERQRISLCTSHEPVRNYIRHSVAEVFRQVPQLAGVFTITMSENLTHCTCHAQWRQCPRCKNRNPWEIVAEVNNLIAEGVHSVKPEARVIAWTWGWHYPGMNTRETIKLLSPAIDVMCTSEEAMPVKVGGIETIVFDYNMACVGPGKRARENWRLAVRKGMKTAAKVQFNTTWQCSSVPYLPVLGLLDKHMVNLAHSGVAGLMLSWTLGGYPSFNLEMVSRFFWQEDTNKMPDLTEFLAEKFGTEAAPYVMKACTCFGAALKEFPFLVPIAYLGPQNSGPANLLYAKPTGYRATMVGFPYDDLDGWRHIFPEEVFARRFRGLSVKWQEGLQELKKAKRLIGKENQDCFLAFERVSASAGLNFRSAWLQIVFVRLRDRIEKGWDYFSGSEQKKTRAAMLAVINEEIALAKELHRLASADSTIGFEATNQYAYTRQDLKEKVLNCESLKEHYRSMPGK